MPPADVGGVKLDYEEAGQGTPLLFVHEFAGDGQSWRPQVRFFSRRYRTITFNARGYPPSDVPEDPRAYSQRQAGGDGGGGGAGGRGGGGGGGRRAGGRGRAPPPPLRDRGHGGGRRRLQPGVHAGAVHGEGSPRLAGGPRPPPRGPGGGARAPAARGADD